MISGGFSVSFSTPASSTLQQPSNQTSSQYIVSDSDRESVEWLLFCITMRFDIMKTTEELQAVPRRTPSHEVEGSIKELSNMWVGFEGTGFHLRRRDPEIWLVAKEPRFFLKKRKVVVREPPDLLQKLAGPGSSTCRPEEEGAGIPAASAKNEDGGGMRGRGRTTSTGNSMWHHIWDA